MPQHLTETKTTESIQSTLSPQEIIVFLLAPEPQKLKGLKGCDLRMSEQIHSQK
jgi:hypothetical protein